MNKKDMDVTNRISTNSD